MAPLSQPYPWLILCVLVIQYVVSVLVDRLNLHAMGAELPSEFRDVYAEETYARSQSYTRARTHFSLWPRTFNLGLLLAFWGMDGFDWLDLKLRTLALGPILTGLLFWGLLLMAQAIANVPFRVYSTFVIEERFGFNRTTVRTFVSDILKGAVLGLLLGAPIGALLLWLFARASTLAWLYCWGATAGLILVIQFVAPRWLMPLFIKFTPLRDGELRTRIVEYARSVAFPLENLFVIDGSRRSSKANAFFTGFGKHRRIGLFDTLVERYSPEEIVAVVAHEVGHYKKRHVIQGMVLGIAQLGLTFFVFGLLLAQPWLYEAFSMSHASTYAGLVFCSLLYHPVDMLFSLWMLARSRQHEYEADRFAVETTGLGMALASGLKKLSKDSLSNLTPHPWYVVLHYTHPPLAQRIAAIRAESERAKRILGEAH